MFKEEWLDDPEFSSWVSGHPDDEIAYCKVCKKYIMVKNGVSQLRVHATGIKHNHLLSKKGKNTLSRLPSKKWSNSAKALKGRSQTASNTGYSIFNVINSSPLPIASSSGIRHNQLLKASKKGKNTSSRSSLLSKKSFNFTKPSKVHSQKARKEEESETDEEEEESETDEEEEESETDEEEEESEESEMD